MNHGFWFAFVEKVYKEIGAMYICYIAIAIAISVTYKKE